MSEMETIEATEEFAMPMDLSPEHSAPVIEPTTTPEALELVEPVSLESLEPEAVDASGEASEPHTNGEPHEGEASQEIPEHEQVKEHNGILYTGLVPPDFTRVVVMTDIQDETCLAQPIEEGSVFAVIRFDGNDSSVGIRPEGVKTEDGLFWLQPEEYEVVSSEDGEGETEEPASEEPDDTTPQSSAEPVAEETPGTLTKSQQLRFQHHESIIKRQMRVDTLLWQWEEAKTEAKRAKEDYEKAVDALQALIRTPPTQPSLFKDSEPETAEAQAEVVATEATEDTEEEKEIQEPQSQFANDDYPPERADQMEVGQGEEAPDPESWRKTPLTDLIPYGMSDAIAKKFAEGGIKTLGDASDFQMGDGGRRLTDIKGVGQAKVDKFEEASAAWHADHPMPSGEAETVEPQEIKEAKPSDVNESLRNLLDHEFDVPMCERFEALGVLSVDDALNFGMNRDERNALFEAGTISPNDYTTLIKVVAGHCHRTDHEMLDDEMKALKDEESAD